MLFKILSSTVKEEVGKYVWIDNFNIERIEIDEKEYRIDFVRKVAKGVYQFGSSNYVFLMRLERIE